VYQHSAIYDLSATPIVERLFFIYSLLKFVLFELCFTFREFLYFKKSLYHSGTLSKYNFDAGKHEYTCDLLSALMFGSEEGQTQFVEWINTDSKMSTTEKKSVLEKLKDFISNIITKLKNHINKSKLNDSEKAVINMDIKKATELRNKVLEALDTAVENVENGNVDADVKYSLNENFDKNYDFSKNIENVANMDSVCDLKGTEFKKSNIDLITQVTDYFNSIGNVAESKYCKVILNKIGVKSSVAHGIGRNKSIAFKAVPKVIEYGEIIDYQEKWKGRKHDTVVFAAPITIDNSPYYMAAVVNVYDDDNVYYLHEVALTKKEDNLSFKTGTTQKKGTPSDKSSSIYILLKKLQIVNSDNKQNSSNKNVKQSLDVDSEGNKLSEQQQEYFKNSKVHDTIEKKLCTYWHSKK
jgi:hypothetical protein